jgi:hypothetical protein
MTTRRLAPRADASCDVWTFDKKRPPHPKLRLKAVEHNEPTAASDPQPKSKTGGSTGSERRKFGGDLARQIVTLWPLEPMIVLL